MAAAGGKPVDDGAGCLLLLLLLFLHSLSLYLLHFLTKWSLTHCPPYLLNLSISYSPQQPGRIALHCTALHCLRL
ncbi:hypothetical protein IWX49DRAFT_579775 [Phyllosticta citricarpa]